MAWKPQTYTLSLPNGSDVEIRKIDPISLIMEDGSIPDNLIGSLLKGQDMENVTPEDAIAFYRLVNKVVRLAMVSPKICDTPDYEADEISLVDVPMADKSVIFHSLMKGEQAQAAAKFSAKQDSNGKPAPAKQVIREKAE